MDTMFSIPAIVLLGTATVFVIEGVIIFSIAMFRAFRWSFQSWTYRRRYRRWLARQPQPERSPYRGGGSE